MANYADGNVVPTRSVAQYAIESPSQEKFSTLTFFVHKLLGNGNFKIAQMKTDYLVKCDSPSDADKLDGKSRFLKDQLLVLGSSRQLLFLHVCLVVKMLLF